MRGLMQSLDVDLTGIGAGVYQHEAADDEHVRGQGTVLATLNVVLLIAVHNLVDGVVDLDSVVARQNHLTVAVNPLHLDRPAHASVLLLLLLLLLLKVYNYV